MGVGWWVFSTAWQHQHLRAISCQEKHHNHGNQRAESGCSFRTTLTFILAALFLSKQLCSAPAGEELAAELCYLMSGLTGNIFTPGRSVEMLDRGGHAKELARHYSSTINHKFNCPNIRQGHQNRKWVSDQADRADLFLCSVSQNSSFSVQAFPHGLTLLFLLIIISGGNICQCVMFWWHGGVANSDCWECFF